MSVRPTELFVRDPRLPWQVDACAMGIAPAALDALPWSRVFAEMEALEAGAVANGDEGRQVGHYWLRAPERAPTVGQATAIGEMIEAVRAFATAVRTGEVTAEDGLPFTDVLHIGIGGSTLGPMLLLDALSVPSAGSGGALRVHFLDNTDPDGIARTLRGVGDLRHALALVVSKSGGTVETANGLALVHEALARSGFDPAAHTVAITQEGSALSRRAEKERWLRAFPMWDWVGGRTSITSAVGLLPAELAGVDAQAFLQGAREMDEWTRSPEWRTNPAALLAGLWHVAGNGHGDRAMVVLPYSDRLLLFGRYLQQLVMESLGKERDRNGRVVHQGLTVYGNKGSTDQHAYVQQLRDGRDDFFALFVQILEDGEGSPLEVAPGVNAGDYLQGFLLGTRRALTSAGRPSLTITMPRVDAHTLGGLVGLFERAVGLYASLVDLNAYHQPGVEAGKKAAAEVIELSRALRSALVEGPATAGELAARLGADPLEAGYVLARLAATGRVIQEAGDRFRLPGA